MENEKILKEAVAETRKVLDSLNTAISIATDKGGDEKQRVLCIDGMIHRFELLLMKMSKILGLALSLEGIDTLSPRSAIQEAVRINWITNPDFWLLVIDARSQTISGTSSLTSKEHINLVSQFATEVEVVLALLGELRK